MRTLKALVMLAVLGAVVVPVAARAEAAVRANIPFEFMAGNAVLPAGTYQFDAQHQGHVIAISNLDEYSRILVLVSAAINPNRSRAEGQLVFNKYGDRYFLAEIWSPVTATGQRLPKSREEREASLKAASQTVLVAVR